MNEAMVVRKHRVLDIPVLGPVLACCLAFLFSEGVFGCIGLIPAIFLGSKETFMYFAAVIGGVVALMIYRKWFHGQFKGTLRMKDIDRKSMWIILGTAFIDLGIVASTIIANGVPNLSLKVLGLALMAGVCEEVCFRAIPMSCAMRKADSKKAAIIAMSISVLAFGIVHCTNIFGGQSLMATFTQVLFAAGFGLFSGAVYLRTGNILITMVIHFLHDFLAFIQMNPAANNITQQSTWVESIPSLLLGVVLVIGGILLLVGHQSDIEEVWKERWNR